MNMIMLMTSKYDLKFVQKIIQVTLTYISWLNNFALSFFKDPTIYHLTQGNKFDIVNNKRRYRPYYRHTLP